MVITIKEYTIGAGNRDRTIVCFVGYKHCESLWLAEQEAMVQAADEATEAVRPSLRGASGQRPYRCFSSPSGSVSVPAERNPRGGFLFSLHRQLYAWTHKRTESDVKWIFWIIGPFNLSMKKAHFRCYLLTWLVLGTPRTNPSASILAYLPTVKGTSSGLATGAIVFGLRSFPRLNLLLDPDFCLVPSCQ
jgi:hypothetical protein